MRAGLPLAEAEELVKNRAAEPPADVLNYGPAQSRSFLRRRFTRREHALTSTLATAEAFDKRSDRRARRDRQSRKRRRGQTPRRGGNEGTEL